MNTTRSSKAKEINVLKKGTVYAGDNGRLICRLCAGSAAKLTGRDVSGLKLLPMNDADAEHWKNEMGEQLTCERGCTAHGEPVLYDGPIAVRFGKNKTVVEVGSIREASAAWGKLRDENCVGASESPKVTVIEIATGKTVATISYNGRAWANDGTEIDL